MKQDFIEFKNIDKTYHSNQVLKQVSIKIGQGEIFGFLGPSGAGKTTLIKLLMAMEKPSSGQVLIDGKQVPNFKIINKIGYLCQLDALYTDLTCLENLLFYCDLYLIPKKERQTRINHVIKIVNLNQNLKKVVSKFSGGMKRRLSLAIALLNQPDILVLDEPTIGMDPILRQQIWNELTNLKASGVTILVTTHVMDEAMKCDRLALIRNGECLFVDKPLTIIEKANVQTLEEAFLKLGGSDDAN